MGKHSSKPYNPNLGLRSKRNNQVSAVCCYHKKKRVRVLVPGPSSIAIFLTGEPVITQIYDAIKSGLSQYDDMVFVGFDAGDRQISWMTEHDKPLLLGSIAQDSYELGYQAVKQVITAAKGKAVEESITTPGVWWDVTNYEELKERKIVYEG